MVAAGVGVCIRGGLGGGDGVLLDGDMVIFSGLGGAIPSQVLEAIASGQRVLVGCNAVDTIGLTARALAHAIPRELDPRYYFSRMMIHCRNGGSAKFLAQTVENHGAGARGLVGQVAWFVGPVNRDFVDDVTRVIRPLEAGPPAAS